MIRKSGNRFSEKGSCSNKEMRSVIAAQHAMAVVIGRGGVARGVVAGARRVAVAIAVITVMPVMITRIDRGAFALPIGRIGCEVAGTAIGRALVGVVILMHRAGVGLILIHRIGQPLVGAAAAVTAVVAKAGDRRGA